MLRTENTAKRSAKVIDGISYCRYTIIWYVTVRRRSGREEMVQNFKSQKIWYRILSHGRNGTEFKSQKKLYRILSHRRNGTEF